MSEERLPRLHSLCDYIDAILLGRAAATIAVPENPVGHMVVLPAWVWREPLIDVGRKGRGRDGAALDMPTRLTWASPIVFTAPEDEVELAWHMSGLGHNARGSSPFRIDKLGDSSPLDIDGVTVTARSQHYYSQRDVKAKLAKLQKAGELARWELMSSLEEFTESKLITANYAVAAEISSTRPKRLSMVLDEISLNELLSTMLHGAGEGKSSVVGRMVERCLAPDTFARVDPMRYLAVNIRARSEEAVRRAIGDPKIGPKVRRVFAATNPSSLTEFIEIYSQKYPNDSLAEKRALAALTAGADPSAVQSSFNDEMRQAASE